MNITIAVDLDGILAKNHLIQIPSHWNIEKLHEYYKNLKPYSDTIETINKLHSKGIKIKIFTSRAKIDEEITRNWLEKNNVLFNEIIFDKPFYNYIIDDRAILLEQLKFLTRTTEVK